MSISHWGIIPGWWEQKPALDGSYKIGERACVWRLVDFWTFCIALESTL